MKEVPNQNGLAAIDLFMSELHKYLPPGIYQPVVGLDAQKEVLEKLKYNTNHGKFSFVLDAQTGELMHQQGISKWLGYPDKTFSIKKYLEITHPAHNIAQWINGSCVWDALEANRSWVNFYDITTIFNEALKHALGHYVYLRCEAFSFQFTANKRGLEFLYEFSVLNKHNREDFSIFFLDRNGERSDMLEWVIKAKRKKFASVNLFSSQEMRILKSYALNKKMTMESIAMNFGIKKETVATYNARIISKAQNLFYHKFESAKKVAEHLKFMEFI